MTNVPTSAWVGGGAVTAYLVHAAWRGRDRSHIKEATLLRTHAWLRRLALLYGGVEAVIAARILGTDVAVAELFPMVPPSHCTDPSSRFFAAMFAASLAIPRLMFAMGTTATDGFRRLLALGFALEAPSLGYLIARNVLWPAPGADAAPGARKVSLALLAVTSLNALLYAKLLATE